MAKETKENNLPDQILKIQELYACHDHQSLYQLMHVDSFE